MAAGNAGRLRGQQTMAQSSPVVLASDQAAIPVNIAPAAAAAGLSIYRNISLGTTGAVVKNGAGKLHNFVMVTLAASVRYVKVYDKATAPTSADTPVATIPLPASGGVTLSSPSGWTFANGISVRGTTGVADNDNTAPSANDIIVGLLGYI